MDLHRSAQGISICGVKSTYTRTLHLGSPAAEMVHRRSRRTGGRRPRGAGATRRRRLTGGREPPPTSPQPNLPAEQTIVGSDEDLALDRWCPRGFGQLQAWSRDENSAEIFRTASLSIFSLIEFVFLENSNWVRISKSEQNGV